MKSTLISCGLLELFMIVTDFKISNSIKIFYIKIVQRGFLQNLPSVKHGLRTCKNSHGKEETEHTGVEIP